MPPESPSPYPSHPYANNSPPAHLRSSRPACPSPRSRATLPGSASESALVRPPKAQLPSPPPAQPKRVKPFLLRGVSGGAVKDEGQQGGAQGKDDKVKEDGIRRSKTLAVLEGSGGHEQGTDAVKVPAKPPPAAKRRTSTFRPLSLAPSSLRTFSSSSSRSRPISHAPVLPAISSPTSAAHPSSPKSPTTVESVEATKLALKRERLQQRRATTSGLGCLPILADELEVEGSPLTRSKKWFSRLSSRGGDAPFPIDEDGENTPMPPSVPALIDAEATPKPPQQAQTRGAAFRDRSNSRSPSPSRSPPSPPFASSSSRNPPHSPLRRATFPASASFSTSKASGSVRGPQGLGAKKKSYAGLGVGIGAGLRKSRSKESVRQQSEESEEPVNVPEEQKHEEGYASLQELLERHGYRDTRVITPRSSRLTLRACSSSSSLRSQGQHPGQQMRRPSAGSLAPPTAAGDGAEGAVKERPSLLSLRGVFSLFSSAPSPDAGEKLSAAPPQEQRAVEGAASSTGTLDVDDAGRKPERRRTRQDLQNWASDVATAQALPIFGAPARATGGSRENTPELEPSSRRAEFGSPSSVCSYSSSLSLSASPPTPEPLRLSPSLTIVGGQRKSLLPPPPRPHKNPLRHAISDSVLDGTGATFHQQEGGYQSFTGLGITLPPSFLDNPSPSSSCGSDEGENGAPVVHITPPAPPPGQARSGSWLVPTLPFLRERASQLFTLSSPSASAFDVATGRSRSPSGGEGGKAGHGPRLLRKAVSTAGLVRPVTTQATVGTRSSAESLSLSIDSLSASGEEGGRGEGLLGRRWAH